MTTNSTPVRSDQAQKFTRQEIATFGAVHLDVTNLRRSVEFWQSYIGLQVRSATDETAELGTESTTLVVLHATAKTPFKNGYSGIYHLAIHPSNEVEFARVLARLITKRYPIAPTDHTMSKALYMEDPDGITVEVTLETPERMARLEFGPRGPVAVDTNGTVRAASAALDVEAVLKALPDRDFTQPLADGTKVGHVHLYVSDVEAAHRFYKGLGFLDNMYLPQYGMADLGAGGAFGHRIAVNAGQTHGRPQAPAGTAGLRYFTIRFDTPERLKTALQSVVSVQEQAGGFLVTDPAGNKVLLTA
ncbi:VOC family protein [Deinococcus pimensis]|uniref:VOC family protein n=1 Tax=Deinococcus pimensis TaxID=309888 RepID=UPI0004843385|nr:VOC family protein [Deinococcus pimensis]